MPHQFSHPTQEPDLTSAWRAELEAAVCENCDWRYLLPQGSLPHDCPHCFQRALTPLTEELDQLAYTHPPELVVPYKISADGLAQSIQDFASGIWFSPKDLNPQTLQERLQQLYLPMWLVDCQVQATWQGEAGFDYKAVSHRDTFDENKGGWSSQRVTETRIRWEPRLGRLQRSYENIMAPALEDHHQLTQKLGSFDLEAGQPYRAETVAEAQVRLPDRPPADAWPEAVPAIRRAAAEECRGACQADHWREFRWQADHYDRNWTLLLLPVYVTYYLDDQKEPQPLLINGQTGQLSGPRRASLRRAQLTTLVIAAVAAVIFALSLMAGIASLFVRELFIVAGLGLIVAILVGVGALVPIAIVWQFNRTHRDRQSIAANDRPSGSV